MLQDWYLFFLIVCFPVFVSKILLIILILSYLTELKHTHTKTNCGVVLFVCFEAYFLISMGKGKSSMILIRGAERSFRQY